MKVGVNAVSEMKQTTHIIYEQCELFYLGPGIFDFFVCSVLSEVMSFSISFERNEKV